MVFVEEALVTEIVADDRSEAASAEVDTDTAASLNSERELDDSLFL